MYAVHPSAELNSLFAHKPYQGVAPKHADVMFVGLDANYDAEIARKQIFAKVVEYHDDGVAFWRRYGVHHPFLLPEYKGDGRLYHRSFARIGLTPAHAARVSFVELLHVPTVGRNLLVAGDLLPAHLQRLHAAILDGPARHVFLPATVARLMRDSGSFPWLPRKPVDSLGPLGILHRVNGKTVYSHLHFSVYGKFASQKAEQALAMHELINSPA